MSVHQRLWAMAHSYDPNALHQFNQEVNQLLEQTDAALSSYYQMEAQLNGSVDAMRYWKRKYVQLCTTLQLLRQEDYFIDSALRKQGIWNHYAADLELEGIPPAPAKPPVAAATSAEKKYRSHHRHPHATPRKAVSFSPAPSAAAALSYASAAPAASAAAAPAPAAPPAPAAAPAPAAVSTPASVRLDPPPKTYRDVAAASVVSAVEVVGVLQKPSKKESDDEKKADIDQEEQAARAAPSKSVLAMLELSNQRVQKAKERITHA